MKNPTNLILIVLSLGLFYTFTSPQYQDMKALQTSANEYRDVIANVSHIAETRDALLVNYEQMPRAELGRLSKILPDNVDTVRLALDLDTIAARYGISIKDVRIETKTDPNAALAVLPDHALPYEKVPVTFTFISNYPNFMKMLGDLEKSLRIMDVKSASFKVSETGLYEHKLTVDTYWLK
jgi:hypothetical protein